MPDSMFGRLAATLETDWTLQARPEQLPPLGDWTTWLILAGRGWGKTRVGSEWIRTKAMASVCRLALVGATAADVRDTMVEGYSGILACCPDWCRPTYEPSKRRLTWPNGSIATLFSAEEADRLRGPQHHGAWLDEVGSMPNAQEVVDMLMFGLRLGTTPQVILTTTPKPQKLLRDLIARDGKDVVITRGSTYDNKANLPDAFFDQIIRKYEGTRLGRQELLAELLTDTPGALWNVDLIDKQRVKEAPELQRVVVAIDPAVSNSENSDETGIVVAGIAANKHVYVLQDLTGRYAPHEWARRAVEAYRLHKADRIVAEANQGGAMVEQTVRAIDWRASYRAVHASRGKVTRAEPISALYEQGMVHHVGSFPALEDQMCAFTSDFDRSRAGYSPDRVDALVWAVTELTGYEVPAAYSMPFRWG